MRKLRFAASRSAILAARSAADGMHGASSPCWEAGSSQPNCIVLSSLRILRIASCCNSRSVARSLFALVSRAIRSLRVAACGVHGRADSKIAEGNIGDPVDWEPGGVTTTSSNMSEEALETGRETMAPFSDPTEFRKMGASDNSARSHGGISSSDDSKCSSGSSWAGMCSAPSSSACSHGILSRSSSESVSSENAPSSTAGKSDLFDLLDFDELCELSSWDSYSMSTCPMSWEPTIFSAISSVRLAEQQMAPTWSLWNSNSMRRGSDTLLVLLCSKPSVRCSARPQEKSPPDTVTATVKPSPQATWATSSWSRLWRTRWAPRIGFAFPVASWP